MDYNPYIVIPLATWAVAQVAKFTLFALQGKLDFRYLYASGGMPSVHSAVVCALATTAFLVDGMNSHLFGFTLIFAAIVMYDSFGVRRSAGEQAAAINMLIGSLGRDRVKLEQPQLRLREILGHQPSEVTVGALLGVVLGALFNYDRLGPLTSFLQVVPVGRELWLLAGIFGFILIAGVVQRFVLRAKYPKSAAIKGLVRRIFVITQVTAWLGLAAAAFQYERAGYLSWRLWSLVALAVGLVWGASLLARSYRALPAALAAEATQARKLKWFNVGRRRSKR